MSPTLTEHAPLILVVLISTLTTVGPLALFGLIGFVKLRTEVRLYRLENQKDHITICNKLTELNGTGHENAEAIVKLETTCKNNHPK